METNKRLTDFAEVNKIVAEVENQFDTSKLVYNEECIWEPLRVLLYRAIYKGQGKVSHPLALDSNKKILFDTRPFRYKRLELSTIYYRENVIQDSCDILIFEPFDNCRSLRNGMPENQYFDSLIDDAFISKSVVKLIPFSPESTLYKRSIPAIHFFKQNTKKNTPIPYIEGIDPITKYLKRNYPHCYFSASHARQYIATILNFEKAYNEILSLVKPKAVFFTSYKNANRFGLIRSCKRLKIPTVDVQHGHIEESEYTSLPRAHPKSWSYVPDYLWVWGNMTKSALETSAQSKNSILSILVGGNRHYTELVTKVKKLRVGRGGNPRITNIGIAHQYNEPFLIESIAEAATENDNLTFIVRLHPKSSHLINEYKIRLEHLKNIRIHCVSEFSYESFLSTIDLLVTVSSTVAFEAHSAGIPVIIYGESGKKAFHHFNSYAGFVFSNNLLEGITEALSLANTAQTWPSYFENNSELGRNALEKILSKKIL